MMQTRAIGDPFSAPNKVPSREDMAATIADLRRSLDARDRTIDALIGRLSSLTSTRSDGGEVAAELDRSLEDLVARRNREVEAERQQLAALLDWSRRTQTRMLQMQKMESIGQLAAGVAHEINTPTQYISDNVTFLKRAFELLMSGLDAAIAVVAAARDSTLTPEQVADADEAIRRLRLDFLRRNVPDAFAQSIEGLNRVATIVSAMKQFSHPSLGEKEPVDLAEVIRTTVTVARNEWKYVAELETCFDPDMPAVPCLRDEIGQVVLNLIVNAAHAIAEKASGDHDLNGRIMISTRHDDEWAEIRIEDTGAGIPEKVRERVFDPFFTTKPVGQGTGQGLAMAYATIVEKHAGQIYFDSELGRGTTFHIRLPLKAPEREG